jgi:hypothetical protein
MHVRHLLRSCALIWGLAACSDSSETPPGNSSDLDGGSSARGIPCEVAAILSEKCALCHGPMPKFNAPMALVSVADFQAEAPITSTKRVREVAIERVDAESGAASMPPPGTVAPLTAAQRSTLSAWLEGGARASAPSCAVEEPSAGTPDAGGTLPASSGAVMTEPYDGWDEGVECFKFVAHDGSKQAKYKVGVATDAYVGFSLMPPWQGTRYVRAYRTVVDNSQALHHFLFFNQGGPVQDGNVAAVLGAHPEGELMQGWAPGGNDLYFSPQVGAEMSGDNGYLLEIHYNSSDADALDASGVEVCVSETPPENVITRAWLGTDSINGTSATGVCDPVGQEPIQIVLGTPHMHLKGRHMRVVINRASGAEDVVHDEAFAFENQRDYPQNIVLQPGDKITTTCTFSEPARFGRGTSEEMCYWFAMHYPAGALRDNGLFGSLVHGANACLGR